MACPPPTETVLLPCHQGPCVYEVPNGACRVVVPVDDGAPLGVAGYEFERTAIAHHDLLLPLFRRVRRVISPDNPHGSHG